MRIIPPPLEPGDRIGIIAPAGKMTDRARFQAGCSIIGEMGFEIVNLEKKWPGYGYLSDCDEARLQELHQIWSNPDVKAVFALRGGFGCLRLLTGLDVSIMRAFPKMLIGFSDITILHNHLFQQIGLIGLHGPVITTLGACERNSVERLYQCLIGNWHRDLREEIEIVRDGPSVSGVLLGGNLSSLTTLLGTPWSPDYTGSVLFLEDVNEPPYRLDRLLTQLFHSGIFSKLKALILGDFTDGATYDANDRIRLHEFVWNRVRELTRDSRIPIWGKFPGGHAQKNITIPIGATVRLDNDKRIMRFSPGPYED